MLATAPTMSLVGVECCPRRDVVEKRGMAENMSLKMRLGYLYSQHLSQSSKYGRFRSAVPRCAVLQALLEGRCLLYEVEVAVYLQKKTVDQARTGPKVHNMAARM